MSDNLDRDPCGDFLDAPPSVAVNAALQQRLLGQTSRMIRRRLWLKRAGFAAGLAACYLAGAATVYVLRPPAPTQTAIVNPPSPPPAPPLGDTTVGLPAGVLENRAFDSVAP